MSGHRQFKFLLMSGYANYCCNCCSRRAPKRSRRSFHSARFPMRGRQDSLSSVYIFASQGVIKRLQCVFGSSVQKRTDSHAFFSHHSYRPDHSDHSYHSHRADSADRCLIIRKSCFHNCLAFAFSSLFRGFPWSAIAISCRVLLCRP